MAKVKEYNNELEALKKLINEVENKLEEFQEWNNWFYENENNTQKIKKKLDIVDTNEIDDMRDKISEWRESIDSIPKLKEFEEENFNVKSE